MRATSLGERLRAAAGTSRSFGPSPTRQEGPMSASKRIKPHATTRSESTLRGIVLVMAMAALLFPVAAWADTVVLDSGTLTLDVRGTSTFRQTLSAFGP